MNREELIFAGYCDIAGLVRGKAFPARDLDSRLARGVSWTPTNIMITAFRHIADSPFGPYGDIALMPDAETAVNVDFGDGTPAEHFYLSDVVNTDGTPWECCPRNFLKQALADLESEAGLKLFTSFEHELYYTGVDIGEGSSYSFDAMRRQGGFGATLVFALHAAGLEPECFHAEYGPRQYEVTNGPAIGLASADRAVILRELARATARRLGHRASFSPMITPDGLGNGVHIHASLSDSEGRPVTYDPGSAHGLSRDAGRFVAGILRHMPAICAITAPSVISYLRLTPNRWSASYNNLGYRDREAGVRICPVFELPGADVAAQYNFEYRAGDAVANPYLALGVLVRAGLEGLREELPMPEPTECDVDRLGGEERERLGIVRLPQSLGEALDALEADTVAKSWFHPQLLNAYLRFKRAEMSLMADLSPAEQCQRYSAVY